MNPGTVPRQNLKGETESFDSSITNLLEEIELSIKWDRPSILLAVYHSEVIGRQAQSALEKQIFSLRYKVTHIKVDKENFDLAWFLSQFDQHEQVVFFVSGLRWGGGRSRTNAYQALNLRRELFVSQKIRMVIWLNPGEAVNLPIHAPDFWAFRHRVVEFTDKSSHPINESQKGYTNPITRHDLLSWRDWQINETADRINEKIKLRESLLAGMPVSDSSLFMRTELMYTLAFLYWNKGRFDKAENYLEQALVLTRFPDGISMKSKLQVATGILYHDQGDLEKAIQRYKKALETNRDYSHGWNNLGRAYLDSGHREEALEAYNRSVKLDPRNANAWNNLGNYYRLNGEFQKGVDAYKKASRFESLLDIPLINIASAYLDLGQPDKAIRALKKANRSDPSNVVTLMKLGNIYHGMNRFKDARTAYSNANKEDPSYFPAYIGLIACDIAMKKPRSAKKHISQALPFLANQNELLQAEFETQRGDDEKAGKLLKRALQKNLTTIQEVDRNPFLYSLREHDLSST
ncbi:MAG TPA: tetratricopeptide repeat protein [Anaerolineales bacterium]|nr:tetratricopeptide repeat protein [Anaerolineales bacterium]